MRSRNIFVCDGKRINTLTKDTFLKWKYHYKYPYVIFLSVISFKMNEIKTNLLITSMY